MMANKPEDSFDLASLDMSDPETQKWVNDNVDMSDPETSKILAPATSTPPLNRSSGERFSDAFLDASQHGFAGMVARKGLGAAGVGMSELRKAYPGRSEEFYKQQQTAIINKTQADMRSEAAKRNELDPSQTDYKTDPNLDYESNVVQAGLQADKDFIGRGAPELAGQILGSADPTMFVNPGKTALARIGAQGALNASSNAIYQGIDKLDDVVKDFDVGQMLESGLAGAGLQGLFEVPGVVKGLFKERGMDTTPGEHPSSKTTPMSSDRLSPEDEAQYTELLKSHSYDDIMRFFDDKNGFRPDPGAMLQWVHQRDAVLKSNTGAELDLKPEDVQYHKQEQLARGPWPKGLEAEPRLDLDEPVQPERAPVTAPEARPSVEQRTQVKQDIETHIANTTKNWTNAPDFEVHDNFEHLDGVDNDAIGAVTPEGKVIINSEAVHQQARDLDVKPEDVVSAVTYHEVLGHHGLSQKFGDGLDATLNKMVKSNTGEFGHAVEQWKKDNPDAYKDQRDRDARAADEVLAEMSENGRINPKIVDVVSNYVKQMGRKAGLKLAYSDREIRTILAQAHTAVVSGKDRDVRSNGYRNKIVWHGTPTDTVFDKFDHNKMGSGEGAQVYGWGTYLTDLRDMADSFYRERLARPTVEVAGDKFDSQANMHLAKEQMVADFNDKHPEFVERASLPLTNLYANGKIKKGITPEMVARDGGLRTTKYLDEHPEYYKEGSFPDALAKYINEDVKWTGGRGQLLEVHLPDDAKWVELDKPIKDQPEVKEVLDKLGFETVTDDVKINKEAEVADLEDRIKSLEDEYDTNQKTVNKFLGEDPYYRHERAGTDRSDEYKTDRNAYNTKRDSPEFKQLDEIADDSLKVLNYTRQALRKAHRQLDDMITDDSTGTEAYKVISKQLGGDKAASLALSKAGLHGNKYLTGSSRKTGFGSHNYVVFDDNVPEIKNRYMKPRKPQVTDEEPYTVKAVRESYGKLQEDYEPKYRSWAEAKRAAADAGLTATQINKIKGVGELDKKLFQNEQAARQLDTTLGELNDKLDSGFTPDDKQKYLQAVAQYGYLQAKIFDDQAEVGRALNAIKALSFTKAKIGQMEEILKEHGGPLAMLGDDETFMRFAKSISSMMRSNNPVGANTAIRNVLKPYWWQWGLSFRHNMMLSGLGTHAKNITDNATIIARELEEAIIALPGGAIRSGLRAAGAKVERGVSPAEVGARMYGLLRAGLDSATYKNTADAFIKGHGNRVINMKTVAQDPKIPVIGKVSDALHAQDVFYRAFMENANLYEQGVREAQKNGLKGSRAFQDGAARAQSPTADMLNQAKKQADLSLLVDNPQLPYARDIERAKTIKPGMNLGEQTGAILANVMFPFFRVSDRLIFQKLRRSPLSFLDARTRDDFKAGGAKRDIAIARTIYGSALIAYYWHMAGQGKTEGAAPDDYKKQQALEGGGYLPNSVKEKGQMTDASALNMSLNPFDLHNSMATEVATVRKAYEKGKVSADKVASVVSGVTSSLMSELASDSFANNIGQWIEPFQGTEERKKNAGANLTASLAGSMLPAAGRQIRQTVTDPIKRDTTGNGSFGDKVKGRMMDSVPGLSDKLPAKYDVYGQEQEQGKSISGMRNNQKIKTDPTIVELQRLERTTDKPVVTATPKSFKVDGQTIELDAEAHQEFQRVTGYYFVKGMESFMKTDEYKQADDPKRILQVKQMHKEAAEAAKEYIMSQTDQAETE